MPQIEQYYDEPEKDCYWGPQTVSEEHLTIEIPKDIHLSYSEYIKKMGRSVSIDCFVLEKRQNAIKIKTKDFILWIPRKAIVCNYSWLEENKNNKIQIFKNIYTDILKRNKILGDIE